MAKKCKLSAQLPIWSYEWAEARLRENPSDPIALEIVLQHELGITGVDRPGVAI
jgi:hypothetical protein